MKSKLSLCILALVAMWAGRISWAQVPPVGEIDPEVQEALEKLKATEPYKRNEVVKEIVKLGPRAVPGLVAAVDTFRQETDTHYVASCIRALGRISGLAAPQRLAATEALIPAMQAPHPQIPYAAATALGSIWSAGGTDQIDTLREVNATLAAAVLERPPDARTYAPALALIEINGIETPTIRKPSSLPTAVLSEVCQAWVARSPQLLPPLREQPWPLLLARLAKGESAAAQQEGKEALVLVKPLPVVDRILEMLRDETTSPPLWGELADVIGAVSGVTYPKGTGPEDWAAVADNWMAKWDQALKGRKDDAHRLYSWQRLEGAIDRARGDTSPGTAERLAALRSVLIHQLDSPEDMPADSAPRTREMLEKPLVAKQGILGALADLRAAVRPDEKMVAIDRIRDLADTDELKAITLLHLDALVAAAREEDRRDREVLDAYAGLLTALTGVPLNLRQGDELKRREAIDAWLKMLELPPDQP